MKSWFCTYNFWNAKTEIVKRMKCLLYLLYYIKYLTLQKIKKSPKLKRATDSPRDMISHLTNIKVPSFNRQPKITNDPVSKLWRLQCLCSHLLLCPPPLSLHPTPLGPTMLGLPPYVNHLSHLLKLSRPLIGEWGQAMCPRAVQRRPKCGHHFLLPACVLGQNGSCQTNRFILLP